LFEASTVLGAGSFAEAGSCGAVVMG
jgi:hypothetical protein